MERKAVYSRTLGEEIAQKNNPILKRAYHVVRFSPQKWVVQRTGSSRAFRVFTTQDTAIAFAKKHAEAKPGTELFIHGIDGGIQQRITVGAELSK